MDVCAVHMHSSGTGTSADPSLEPAVLIQKGWPAVLMALEMGQRILLTACNLCSCCGSLFCRVLFTVLFSGTDFRLDFVHIHKSQQNLNSSADPSDSGINSGARGGQILQRFIGDVMNLRNKNKELNPLNWELRFYENTKMMDVRFFTHLFLWFCNTRLHINLLIGSNR